MALRARKVSGAFEKRAPGFLRPGSYVAFRVPCGRGNVLIQKEKMWTGP